MKRQIRLFTTAIVCMVMTLCVSCKKDDDKSDSGGGNGGGNIGGGGSQTVEMRISKISQTMVIYEEESTDGGQTWNVIDVDSGQTNQIFTWNNNLLSNMKQEIVQDGGECEEIDYDFRYDNNKLSNVIMTVLSYGGSTPFVTSANVTYDGDNMSEVTCYDGEIESVRHLEYSNGKLLSVTFDRGVINYFWNGDNISEVIASGDYFIGDTVGYKFISYDDKKNPYYGIDAFLAISVMAGGVDGSGLSKNNCTKLELYSGGESMEEIEYTYNGENYPTQCVATVISQISDGHRRRGVATATYEYLD